MKFDLQDLLLLAGVGSVVGGVAAWSRPAAAIVFGLICIGCVLLMGRARSIALRAVVQPEEGKKA